MAEVILDVVDYLAVDVLLKASFEELLVVFLHFLISSLALYDFKHFFLLQVAVPHQKLTSEFHEAVTAFEVGKVLKPLIGWTILLFGQYFPHPDILPLANESDIVEHIVDPLHEI